MKMVMQLVKKPPYCFGAERCITGLPPCRVLTTLKLRNADRHTPSPSTTRCYTSPSSVLLYIISPKSNHSVHTNVSTDNLGKCQAIWARWCRSERDWRGIQTGRTCATVLPCFVASVFARPAHNSRPVFVPQFVPNNSSKPNIAFIISQYAHLRVLNRLLLWQRLSWRNASCRLPDNQLFNTSAKRSERVTTGH